MLKKKHAYLIMAHNELEVFKALVSLIDDELHDLYIHIDAKSDKLKFENITDEFVKKSKIKFIPSISVSWGGISLVKAELDLLQAAISAENEYSYYHYLSGVDLPLTANKDRYTFFENNAGKEFIEIQSEPMDKKWERRIKYYWLFEKKSRIFPYKYFRHIVVLLQAFVGINRLKKVDYKIQYGSNWVSITDSLAIDILKYRKELEELFDKTHCSDEFLFQTFIKNNENYSLYRNSKGETSNVRYIDWKNSDNSGSPLVLRKKDVNSAMASEAMFARKFQGQDKDTIELIKKIIGGTKRNS